MIWTPLKVLLLVAGGSAAAAGVAYVSGALDRFLIDPPSTIAALPGPVAEPKPAAEPGPAAEPKGDRVDQPAPAGDPAVPTEQTAPATVVIVAPSFDLVRVEPDGSIVIAGKAAPAARVEILTGSKVLGQTKAGIQGDFAVVLDDPLKPGDYQIVLRSTTGDNVIAMSPETAVVSVPDSADGQVLALVEKPGEPSKLITVPQPLAEAAAPEAPGAAAVPDESPVAAAVPDAADAAPTPDAPVAAVSPGSAEAPATAPQPGPAAQLAPAVAPRPGPVIKVEAVEIEGNRVFVAGQADAGHLVRVYANDILLGEAKAAENGRFLVEALRDLPVGGYIIRADLVAPDGQKVMARAAVPFEREAGQSVAAVAPATTTDASAADQAAQPADQPAQLAPAAPKVAETAPATPVAVAPSASAGAQTPAEPAPAPSVEQPATVTVPDPGLALASEPPAITAPKLEAADSAVIIRRGDTLWRISSRVYGRGVRYSTIYLANQDQISDPDRIWPGQVFKVPEKTGEGETADMEAVADQKAPADDDRAASSPQ